MTLNMTIVSPWGIWQCSDHRLTNPENGEIIQDDSPKHVVFRFLDGGALLAYYGIGRIHDVQMSDWVREILRGESRSLGETISYLREQATISIGPLINNKVHHMFTLGAFLNGNPGVIQICNFKASSTGERGNPERNFYIYAQETKERSLAIVSGARNALSKEAIDSLVRVIQNRPNRLGDFHGLLAKYNRLASKNPRFGKLISPGCTTSFMPPEIDPTNSIFHSGKNEEASEEIAIPRLLFGVDLTDVTKVVMNNLGEADHDFDAKFEKAARDGIHRKNRLSKN